ncbi:cell division protein SepF, partial [Clostridioides difficile]|uniref:cell division protein SepF n=1 Tax=Clostridioides difficile TaxID=1496 RepID=UPI003F8CF8D7
IADHLKQRRAVIVNLEGLTNSEVRKSIFNFMNGAVYVLDGSISGFKILVTIPVMPLEDIIPITAPIGMATVHKIKICKITI